MKNKDVLKASLPYWKSAALEFKSIKQITAASLLVALGIVIGMFDIRIIPNVLQVSFSYIAFSICSFITGPLMAIPCGIIADLVDALWHGYDLFFGYTLSAVAQGVIFALFFYRRELTLPRIVAAKACVNLFVNVLLGSVWRLMMMGGEYFYYVFVAGLKNLIMLPFEVIILVVLLRALIPPLRKLKMIPAGASLKVDRTDIILTCVLFALVIVLAALYFGNYTEINGFVKNLLG
ncbi:MAG: folate family ECF transporter S component [Clostridia bacterium]|nr:folate family ECF transporter S component [Clostridia bacterium]